MGQNGASRPSPAMLVAVLALVAALAGTAFAGQQASTSAINKKKVKKIARKQINKLAPGLSVANAENATNAQNATNAVNAQKAVNAQNADNATSAETLGGIRVRKFAVKLPSGQGETALINFGGVALTGRCEFGAPGQHGISAQANPGTPSMVAAVTATNTTTDAVEAFRTPNFNSLDLGAPDDPPASIGHFIATTTTGRVTEVSYLAANAGNFSPNQNVCSFSGTATSG